MQEVQVLEATRTAPNSRGRVRSNPITVERIRVAPMLEYLRMTMTSWAALNPRNFIMKRKLVRIPNGLMPGFLLMRRLPEPRPTSEPDFRK